MQPEIDGKSRNMASLCELLVTFSEFTKRDQSDPKASINPVNRSWPQR
jgi:hypothetical protein